MKGIYENSPALHIELFHYQRWINVVPRLVEHFKNLKVEFHSRLQLSIRYSSLLYL